MDNAASTTHCPNEFRRARSRSSGRRNVGWTSTFPGVSRSLCRLSPVGSPFRLAVWRILLDIPWGQVVTYGDIARRLEAERGGRVSAQAIGGAVGHNPISLMIPCHRVIGAGGNLVGYAGGLPRKRYLLELEGVDVSGLHAPLR